MVDLRVQPPEPREPTDGFRQHVQAILGDVEPIKLAEFANVGRQFGQQIRGRLTKGIPLTEYCPFRQTTPISSDVSATATFYISSFTEKEPINPF